MTPHPTRPGRAPSRSTLLVVGAATVTVLTLTVLSLVILAAVEGPGSTPSADRGGRGGVVLDNAPRGSTDAAGRRATTSPPARVCGSPGLRGPVTGPPGFVRVTTAQRLDLLVSRSRPGTKFWLAPGVHRLGDGMYDQVGPKDGMVFTGAPGAVLDGRRTNRYAFGGEATDVLIEHLTIQNFGEDIGDNQDEGVVNHDTGRGWRIRHNTVRWNGGAGVFIGDANTVDGNCLAENGQYGFSAYEDDGVRDVLFRNNEVSGNNTARHDLDDPYCGCTGGGKFWETTNADITGNWIHDNRGVGIWADTNNNRFLVSRNFIADNDGEGMIYEISYNAEISYNTFFRNGIVEGPHADGFPIPALYLSESGSDPRAAAEYGATFRVVGNRFVDNWGGVIAWENADRFAGSPNNTSSGTTTLVNPEVASEPNCGNRRLVASDPYFDDCRWKTQRLRVRSNLFRFTPSHLGKACTAANLCGFNGLFSQVGTSPDWSPYKGTVIEKQITFEQDNLWQDNHYLGPWRFMVEELGHRVSWKTWRGSTYQQDEGSTLQ